MTRGKFIVFEGPNACGKGTQITLFQDKLRSIGKAIPVFITGEPNETFDKIWGAKAREILKRDGNPYQNQLESLECFSKNRYIHNRVFGRLLEMGAHVISDRYYNSTFAFQHAQGIPYNKIAEINTSDGVAIPDLTILLDVPVEVSIARLKKRDREQKRKFETDFAFMKKVRANYLEQPQILPGLMNDKSTIIIDGTNSVEKVSQEIWQAYTSKFGHFHAQLT